MELTLNLAWALVALWMVCLWLRFAPRSSAGRRTRFAALAVLILILLPAISITDDLLAAQNPAEIDCCLRRDHKQINPHAIFPAIAAPPLPAFAGLWLGAPQRATAGDLPTPMVQSAAVTLAQDRAPPTA